METPTFNFFHHWYPIVPLEDLDPDHPIAVVLLGQRMVIWKPRFEAQYRVFLDQCPHRLAPLSEGRVDEKTGNLLCSYLPRVLAHLPPPHQIQITRSTPASRKPFILSSSPVGHF